MIWALHGNLGDGRDWEATAAALSPLPVVSPCLWRDPPSDFVGWAATFLAGMERETQGRRVLMGYSLGARLAMHALLARPEDWAAAIFVSGHPGLEEPRERDGRLQQDLVWARWLRNGTSQDFADAWNAQAVFAGEDPPPCQEEILATYGNAIAAAFDRWSLGRQEFLGDRLRSCAVPQLWVAGERDAKFAALAEAMAGPPGGRTVVVLKNCGHRVLLQKPRELAECIRRFLEACNLIERDVETSR